MGDRRDRPRRRPRRSPTTGRSRSPASSGLVTVLYVFASTYRRRWAVLPALPFLVNAVAPYSGDDPGFSGVLLLTRGRRGGGARGLAPAAGRGDRRARRDAAGDGRHVAGPGSDGRAGTDCPRPARRGRAPRLGDRRPGRDRAPDHRRACRRRDAPTSRRSARRPATRSPRCGACSAYCGRTSSGEAARDPQPGLARLNELVDTARAAGTPVRLTLSGDVAPLAARSRSLRLPDPPGGAHERPPARARRRGRRRARLRLGRAAPSCPRPRPWSRRRRTSTGTGSSACASARSWSAGRCARARRTVAASRSRRSCPIQVSADMTVRVVVVDDQEIVRAGFAALLATQPDFTVVGTAADGEEAVRVCREQRPRRRADGRAHACPGRDRGDASAGRGRRSFARRSSCSPRSTSTSTSTTRSAPARAGSCSRT